MISFFFFSKAFDFSTFPWLRNQDFSFHSTGTTMFNSLLGNSFLLHVITRALAVTKGSLSIIRSSSLLNIVDWLNMLKDRWLLFFIFFCPIPASIQVVVVVFIPIGWNGINVSKIFGIRDENGTGSSTCTWEIINKKGWVKEFLKNCEIFFYCFFFGIYFF